MLNCRLYGDFASARADFKLLLPMILLEDSHVQSFLDMAVKKRGR